MTVHNKIIELVERFDRNLEAYKQEKQRGRVYTFDKLGQSEEKGSTFDPCKKRR